MKRTTSHAFTLIEMITVVAIIIVLAGLVIGTAGLANKNAAKNKALGEIKDMGSAHESYKIDNGDYLRTQETDDLDPRSDFSALSGVYQKANIQFYSALSGDYEPQQSPDGKAEKGSKVYKSFERSKLNHVKNSQGEIQTVNGIIDPFGQYYGYSTAGAAVEAEYRKKAKVDPAAARETEKKGFNSTYDLWSTAGGTTMAGQDKWVKNWGAN